MFHNFLLLVLFSYFAQSTGSQETYNKYLIKDVGHILIPDNMELQPDAYNRFSDSGSLVYAKKSVIATNTNRVIFQQKDLNTNSDEGYKTYARIVIETTIGELGDYQTLASKFSFTPTELKELDDEFQHRLEKVLQKRDFKVLNWYGTQNEIINGVSSVHYSYLRNGAANNFPVNVDVYIFNNNDREHMVTLSYRERDSVIWKPVLKKVIDSFEITNVR